MRVPSAFPRPGLAIYVVGETFAELGGSEFAEAVLGVVTGKPPALDPSKERALLRFLVAAAGGAMLTSAHDCGDGGLVIALLESAIGGGHGFKFAAVVGKILAELAVDGHTGHELSPFRIDRAILQLENPPKHYMV